MRGAGAIFLPEILPSLHVGGQVNLAHNSGANSSSALSSLSLVSLGLSVN